MAWSLEQAYDAFPQVEEEFSAALEESEAAWLWGTMGVDPANADPAHTEAAIAAAGPRIDERIIIGSEWGEWLKNSAALRAGSCCTPRACCMAGPGTPSASGRRLAR